MSDKKPENPPRDVMFGYPLGLVTLRDLFAAAALAGLALNANEDGSVEMLTHISGRAYRLADAMLRERERAK